MADNTERRVALALLSERHEVLLSRRDDQPLHTLPYLSVDRNADDEALERALAELLDGLIEAPETLDRPVWLGRFILPDERGRHTALVELYTTALPAGIRLRRQSGQVRGWAALTAPAPEGVIQPAIELQILPVLASLVASGRACE
ncbi:hypothetical protein [Kushneria aurantia]|uniref:NUDIX hydrolase n=1 Tax=Kushneria aurantia TaxID=504092 RepID=A0ABV6G7D8_9GAMM|nr:hypothetical protein [Kushneria aurantia]